MSRLQIIVTISLLAMFASPGRGAAKSTDLDTWFAEDLTPYVREQLTTHPRFQNQMIRIVVVVGQSPQSEGSALALTLRDRLQSALTQVAGIRVAWQANQAGVALASGPSGADCTRGNAQYFVGIELTEDEHGIVTVQVRALDILERNWVPGFGKTWRGLISSGERRALHHIKADPTFLGARNAPYTDSEADLMAAHLAYELGCSLLRQTAGEYVISLEPGDAGAEHSVELIELVRNNLVDFRALQFSQVADETNAIITGKAHQIDGDLYQYWISIIPADSSSSLTALSADAYIRIPDKFKAALLVPEAYYELKKTNGGFLDELQVVQVRNAQTCTAQHASSFAGESITNRMFYAPDNCYALQVRASGDAVVFFLNHQLNNGLVRLGGEDCGSKPAARIARTRQPLQFALPLDSLQSSEWSITENWSVEPDKDTYYVLAAADTKAARALSHHIEQLPRRCSTSVRHGLEGADLQHWLEELGAIANKWESVVDWQSIRIKNVY